MFRFQSFKFQYLQNVLGAEGMGFKIAMGAFDKTRPPVSTWHF